MEAMQFTDRLHSGYRTQFILLQLARTCHCVSITPQLLYHQCKQPQKYGMGRTEQFANILRLKCTESTDMN